MFSNMIILLIILNLPFSLGCATTQSPRLEEKEKSSYNLITEPAGAKIVVSKFGREGHEYLSPSAVSLIDGCGFIEISKDGYWDEDRLVMDTIDIKNKRQWGDMITGAIAGGLAGALIMAPVTPDHKIIQKSIINDQTRFQLDILDRKSSNPSNYNSNITGNTVEVKLIKISAPLKPIISSLKIDSENSYKEVSKRVEKLHSEGKISKEEFLRAKKKINDVYNGKFQKKN